jgi:DNA-binding winged helix-turn-helix (wHTH) protein/tetratricopeptide (TPR) repeat protein
MFNEHNRLREFGRLRLDLENKFLWHESEPVDLPLKGLELLCLLVEKEGSVVSKPEIWESVWQNAFVEETNLTHHIYLLRRKFKELGEPDPIETVPRRGYRFRTRENADEGFVIERHAITKTVIEEMNVGKVRTAIYPRFKLLALTGSSAVVVASIVFGGYALAERSRIVSPRTIYATAMISPRDEARAEYKNGRTEWNKRTWGGMLEAQRHFRNAIATDRDFAPAYAGLADTLAMGPDRDESPRIIERALELDPHLAEAHASKGFIAMFHDRNWTLAEESLKRAIALDPGYATAHQWYATLLAIQGRNDEAKASMLIALESQPKSPNLLADMGQIHYFSKEYKTAETFCRKALEIDPAFIFAWEYLHDIYLKTGEHEKAVDAELEAQRLNAPLPNDASRVRDREALDRQRQRDLFAIGGIERFERDRGDNASGVLAAARLAFVGDREAALDRLEKAAENGEFLVVFAKADPVFDSVRSDPRFHAVLRRLRLD